jgi:hypothetical protein
VGDAGRRRHPGPRAVQEDDRRPLASGRRRSVAASSRLAGGRARAPPLLTDDPLAELTTSCPPWVAATVDREQRYAGDDERMRLAVALSLENVVRETGEPFGAAVFESESGRLVEDASRGAFDEGPRFPGLFRYLGESRIEIARDVLRADARLVLEL